jgi:ribosome-associated protein
MSEPQGLRVNRSLVIPWSELEFSFTPSGGPGGQHANRSSTRAELSWNVDQSSALGPRQRSAIKQALRHRIDGSGNLRLASDAHRSQLRNREEVVARLHNLLIDALQPRKARVPTKRTRSSQHKRLEEKKRRSSVKSLRRSPPADY